MASIDDPVESVSSRVQAVISYFAPTDWLNYGAPGKSVFEYPRWDKYHGVLDLNEYDASRSGFNRITDRALIDTALSLNGSLRTGMSNAIGISGDAIGKNISSPKTPVGVACL